MRAHDNDQNDYQYEDDDANDHDQDNHNANNNVQQMENVDPHHHHKDYHVIHVNHDSHFDDHGYLDLDNHPKALRSNVASRLSNIRVHVQSHSGDHVCSSNTESLMHRPE